MKEETKPKPKAKRPAPKRVSEPHTKEDNDEVEVNYHVHNVTHIHNARKINWIDVVSLVMWIMFTLVFISMVQL